MTRNTLLVAAAVVGALALGQAHAATTDRMTQQQTDYQRYARVVLGEGDRTATTTNRANVPPYDAYRSVIQGLRFEPTGTDAERKPLTSFDAYQRVVGGRIN